MKRLLLSGWRINDELFDAMVQARGLTYDGKWNSQHNSLYVNFQQGKELRDALRSRGCCRREATEAILY